MLTKLVLLLLEPVVLAYEQFSSWLSRDIERLASQSWSGDLDLELCIKYLIVIVPDAIPHGRCSGWHQRRTGKYD